MILLTSMLRRLPGLTHEEFVTYHRGHHAPLFASTAPAKKYLRRYAIEHPQPTLAPGLPRSSFDAIVRMEFDSRADLARMFTSKAYRQVIRPDEKRFLDFAASEFFLSEEHIILGAGAPAEPPPFTVPARTPGSESPAAKPKIRPQRWRPEPAEPGQRSPMTNLTVFSTGGFGAEDVAVRPDGQLVTGFADGRIVALDPETGACTTLASTGGRPLGIEVHPDGGLVVCDKERGLVYVSGTGEVHTLADEHAGAPIYFANNAAVARDGTIYFSDSSSRFGLADWAGDIIEHRRTGRLFRRTPDGQVDLLADGLAFANGVALASDESFVVVAQTTEYDVQRIQLTGPQQGARSRFARPLPGFPDNISTGEDGNLWVSIVAPRVPLVDFLVPRHPFWRQLIWAIPEKYRPQGETPLLVRAYRPDGTLVHDFAGRHPAFGNATGARQTGDHVWLSSIRHAAVARFDLTRTGA